MKKKLHEFCSLRLNTFRQRNMYTKLKTYGSIGLWVIFLSVIMVSCKTTSKAGKSSKKNQTSVVLTTTQQQNVSFEAIAIQGRAVASIPSDGTRMSLGYRINMISDSLIWMRFSKFGFEGARVLVTPDSIFMVDRLNKTAYVGDYAPARTYLGMDATIDMLQAIFIGNFRSIPVLSELSLQRGQSSLNTFMGRMADAEFTYTIDANLHKLKEVETKNISKNLHSIIQYDDFETLNKFIIPKNGKIDVVKPDEMNITFKHNNIDINPSNLTTGFSIPDNYERVSF